MFLKNVNEIINFFLVAFFESVTRSQMKFFFFFNLKRKSSDGTNERFFLSFKIKNDNVYLLFVLFFKFLSYIFSWTDE